MLDSLGIFIRPATLGDLEDVFHLIGEQNLADYGEAGLSRQVLEERWRASNLNLAKNTWVAHSAQGRLAGYAELWEAGENQYHLTIYTESEFRSQEVGEVLLQSAETSAAQRSTGLKEIILGIRVSDRNREAMEMLEKNGYAKTSSFEQMEIRIQEPPPGPHWPAGIHVRNFAPGQDEQSTYLADERASQDKRYHKPMSFAE